MKITKKILDKYTHLNEVRKREIIDALSLKDIILKRMDYFAKKITEDRHDVRFSFVFSVLVQLLQQAKEESEKR